MARRFCLLLGFAAVCLCDQAVGNFITDVFDIKTVCAPDSMLCSHGGRTFRDRNHNCEFTPCEFVDPPSVAPTPAPGSQRMNNATTWFRNEEFFVPRIRFRDLKHGRKIADRVTKVLHAKSQRAIKWSTTGSGGGNVDTVDIIAVPSWLTVEQPKNRTEGHNELLQEALSTGGNLDLAQQGKLLVTSRKPWTRFAFFGWLARHPTSSNVMEMLRVVQDTNSLDTLIKQNQQQHESDGSSRGVFDVATELLPRQIVAIPSLVLMNASMEGDRRDNDENAKQNWFTNQPEAVLVQVLEFLERRLMQMGHLEPQRPVTTVETRRATLNASTGKTNGSATEDTNIGVERTTSVNRSVKFASRYKSESASLRVFLTPFASLVGEDDKDSSGAKHREGTYIHNVSVWNFTMVLCDVFEKVRQAHQHSSVPLTVLVQRGSSASNDTGAGATMASEHSSSFGADEGSSSSNATEESFAFTCWLCQQIEDGRGLPVANASATMQAVRYYHQV